MTSSQALTHHISLYLKIELNEARGVSPKTYKAYRLAIKSLADYLSKWLKKPLFEIKTEELSYECIYDYMIYHHREKNWGSAAWNQRLSAFKSFLNFLARTDFSYTNLYRRVCMISSKTKNTETQDYITLHELETALIALPTLTKNNFRNKVIFQLLFFSGIRVEELTGVRFQDVVIVRKGCVNLYVVGKGRKGRNIPIMEKATVKNLQKYIELISRRGVNNEYIFHGYKGARMSEENIRKICRIHFNPLIENKHISPHSFRHSAAMNWLESGVEIMRLSTLLGHKNVDATMSYLHATFGLKVEALIRGGQNKKLSSIFEPQFSTNEEYWESMKIRL